MSMIWVILACVGIILYGVSVIAGIVTSRHVRLHLSMNTEDNEQVNFNFSFPMSYGSDKMLKAINKVYEASEGRRAYQYQRMVDLRTKQLEEAKKRQEEEKQVSELAKKRAEKGNA